MLVIGCGAAGMFAAIAAAENGSKVTILEKNEKAGKKIYITGKGRCNITNNSPIESYFKNIINNPKFLMSALNAYGPYDTIEFFENNKVKLTTERGNRVFPLSGKSSDIIRALQNKLNSLGVEIKFNTSVKELSYENNRFRVVADNCEITSDTLIIATGGVSYKSTGSTGDGYEFAKKLGHSVVEPKGGLVGMLCDNTSTLSGLTLKNVDVGVYSGNKLIATEFGELLFTHIGLSGPTVLSLSSKVNRVKTDDLHVKIDLKPALDTIMLDKRVLRDFGANNNKMLVNSLNDLLPKSLISEVIKQSGLKESVVVNQITKEQRAKLVEALKGLIYKIKGFDDINNAIITSGGVCVKEINPKTMESKLIKGLYFAGEIIDVDALTGGYNLQIALATGYVAGISAANYERRGEI